MSGGRFDAVERGDQPSRRQFGHDCHRVELPCCGLESSTQR
jgi:hypothetical protein